jgi:hypothetical protein
MSDTLTRGPSVAELMHMASTGLARPDLARRVENLMTSRTATERLLRTSLPSLVLLMEQAEALGIAPLGEVDCEWTWRLRRREVKDEERDRAMYVVEFGPLASIARCGGCAPYPASAVQIPATVYDVSQTVSPTAPRTDLTDDEADDHCEGEAASGDTWNPDVPAPYAAAGVMWRSLARQLLDVGYHTVWPGVIAAPGEAPSTAIHVDHQHREVHIGRAHDPLQPTTVAGLAVAVAAVAAQARTCQCGAKADAFA